MVEYLLRPAIAGKVGLRMGDAIISRESRIAAAKNTAATLRERARLLRFIRDEFGVDTAENLANEAEEFALRIEGLIKELEGR
jgi:hypothetical protein